MLIPICIACGFLIMICSYTLVRAWDEVTGDFPIVGTILVVIAMSIWSCFLGLGEDYHRGKIKTVITTIQSDGNLIKQEILRCLAAIIVSIAVTAFFMSIFIYLLWSVVIPAVFPKLVAEGYIVGKLSLALSLGSSYTLYMSF